MTPPLPTEDTPLAEAALLYASRGWPVVVLHGCIITPEGPRCSCRKGLDCSSAGKHPRLPRWPEQATTDLEEIRALWRRYPDSNIGLAMGREGSRLLAVDVDGQEGRDSLAQLPSTPPTLTSRSGREDGGQHLVFRVPPGIDLSDISNRQGTKLGAGIDVRGQGGQIVVAPSLHPSGQRYRWTTTLEPQDAPAWMLLKLQAPPPASAYTPPPLPPSTPGRMDHPWAIDTMEGRYEEVSSTSHRRHTALFSAASCAGEYIAAGHLDEGDVRRRLRDAGLASGLSEDREFWHQIDNGIREGKKTPRHLPELTGGGGSARPPRPRASSAQATAPPQAPGETPPGGADEPPGDDGPWDLSLIPDPLHRASHVYLARVVARVLSERGELVYDEGALWQWRGSLWERLDLDEAAQIVQTLDGWPVITSGYDTQGNPKTRRLGVSDGLVNGVLSQMVKLQEVARPGFFDDAPRGLAFENGFLQIQHGYLAFEPSAPEQRQRVGQAMAWDLGRRAPRFHQALAEWFPESEEDGGADARAKRAFLQEFVGAALFGLAPQYATCAMLYAEGSNGKSTFISLIEALFPATMRSAFTPQQLCSKDSDYFLAELAGKRLNASAELPDTAMLKTSTFKQVITGDPTGARSPGERPFTFRPQAAHLFSANKLPATTDRTMGFWRRWTIIEFDATFLGKDDNKDMTSLLLEELGGVLVWAVDGALRLKARGAYTSVPSSDRTKARWMKRADTVLEWLDECCDIIDNPAKGTKGSTLRADFDAWVKDCNYNALGARTFFERLQRIVAHRRTGAGQMYAVVLRQERRF